MRAGDTERHGPSGNKVDSESGSEMSTAKNRCFRAAVAAGMMLTASAALAGGPFDGTWVGKDSSGPCTGYAAAITVVNSNATGSVTGPYGIDNIRDKYIHSDGSAIYYTHRRKPIHLQFTGNSFEINEEAECGSVSITGTRQ